MSGTLEVFSRAGQNRVLLVSTQEIKWLVVTQEIKMASFNTGNKNGYAFIRRESQCKIATGQPS